VTSGDPCFFIGTDTAPHLSSLKEAACGCAGVFVGATALQTYAQVFDEEGALDRLEKFASVNGAKFYGLPANAGTIELKRRPAAMPAAIAVDGGDIVVFRGDEPLPWSIGEVRP
jgi:dihydroorotase